MLKIGKINKLTVVDELPFGFYLESEAEEKVLLPNACAPKGCKVGDEVEAFIYHDSDDRIIATTEKPLAMLEDVAFLKAKSITKVGTFLDWGLAKDLLVPFNEQDKPMEEGLGYVVYVFQDEETGRLAASTMLRRYLHEDGDGLWPKQQVKLQIYGRSDMGYKVVIDDTYLGLLFRDEAFRKFRIGEITTGYIKRIREDNKIDVCLQFHDDNARSDLAQQILDDLEAHGGISTLTDKSPAEEITTRFKVSKSAYKKALGALYKQRKITLDKTKITLIK